MESIKDNSTLLQFTCDYEKYLDMKKSDYVQIPLGNIKMPQGGSENVVAVLELDGLTSYVTIGNGRGKIGKYDLSDCQIERLHQKKDVHLHVDIDRSHDSACEFYDLSCSSIYQFFGRYPNSNSDCVKKVHRCLQSHNSTTQLWFGNLVG